MVTPRQNEPAPQSPHGWQFSLRTFLLAAVALGLLAGVLGPLAFQLLGPWSPVTAPPPRSTPPPPRFEPNETGYFESAETPLD